ncbi:recombinase family protein [Bacillus paranthracis]|uniref:recombinase family protein n=1 Tax=Bacillus paranthracis TaxID=2026186 RepID=UPI00254B9A58|nr:recombinase family protein [Bacillus paranthracis]MDK7419273.1 recombinase family protein [Bacillus paranthracis]MDK7430862.1 recombinase family protein [Bacillus paranthracis]MDK7516573.1 recombinase family protein [Bacillus paranthracis]MDK7572407.1 recombinase family protein [Bacillus paranthracis]
MKEIKHVAIYLRLSRNEENLDIDEVFASHQKVLFKMCEDNKWTYEIFKEVASSVYLDRKQLNVMLDKVKENEFDAVLVMDIDRLSRDVFDAPTIFKVLNNSKTNIVTPSKTYDWDKDEDVLLLNIQMVVAAQEYKQIKKRMTRGKKDASEIGLWVHGIPPLGYDKDPNTRTLVPNDDRKHIEFIFNSIVKGKTVSDVFNQLNSMGVKTRTGSKFHFNAILRLVNNEAYKGTLVYNKFMVTDERKKNGKRKTKLRPKEQWKRIENAHPSIVDEDIWEKANKIVNTYSFSKKRSNNITYPTSKLIYCANCDRLHSVHVTKYEKMFLHICKYCNNRSYAYGPILKHIKEAVADHRENVLALITDVKNENDSNTDYQKMQLETQIRKATQALNQIEILFEEMEINLKQYRERKAKRNEEIEQLKEQLENIQQTDPKEKVANLTEILQQVDYLLDNWEILDSEGLTNEEINFALHIIIEKITWKYGFDGEEPELKIMFKQ